MTRHNWKWFAAALLFGAIIVPPTSTAQVWNGDYRIETHTVYEPRQATYYRTRYETVYEPRQITRYTPQWTTETRQRTYRVWKPVDETSYREEKYTVCRPVTKVEYRERCHEKVTWVQETSEREETVTVWKPIWETAEREVRRTVLRPVMTQEMRQQCHTVMQPVVTYQTRWVDMGCCVDQAVYVPGKKSHKLTWQSAKTLIDPVTGCTRNQCPGLYWTPVQAAGTYEVRKAWKPNLVAQQCPVTRMVPQQFCREVPVQVCRYEQQEIVETVPYRTCRWVQEVQVRKRPCVRWVPKREQVCETYPVRTCTWQTQECVRRVPVTTRRWVQEERVESCPQRVCRMVPTVETVYEPRCVRKCEAVPYPYLCAKTYYSKVPIDACGNPVGEAVMSCPSCPPSSREACPDCGAAPRDAAPYLDGYASPPAEGDEGPRPEARSQSDITSGTPRTFADPPADGASGQPTPAPLPEAEEQPALPLPEETPPSSLGLPPTGRVRPSSVSAGKTT